MEKCRKAIEKNGIGNIDWKVFKEYLNNLIY